MDKSPEINGEIRAAKDALQRASEGLQKLWFDGTIRLEQDRIESYQEDLNWIEKELPMVRKLLSDFENIALKKKLDV